MPTVVNGIGTWYSGKRNISTRRGTCDFCQAFAELKSFDTTLFFVVFFIPIIPLGTKRISDECPSCRRHRVADLRKWEAAKTETIGNLALAVQNKPSDPQAAIDALAACIGFRAKPEFLGLAESLSPPVRANAKVLGVLGDGFTAFEQIDDARAAYEAALAASPADNDIRRAAALHFLRHAGADEGYRVARPILDRATPDDVGFAYLVCEAYQSEGRHAEARSVLTALAQQLPDVAATAEFKKYLALCDKHERSGKKIRSLLLSGPAARSSDSAWSFNLARWIPVGVALLAVVGYLFAAIAIGASRTVHVVGGLSEQYVVTIAGRTATLNEGYPVAIKIPEGEHTVAVVKGAARLKPQKVVIETSFFLRPFTSAVFVINPDELALLSTEDVSYSVQGSASAGQPDTNFRLHTPKLLHTFSKIDYPFTQPPRSIKLSKSSGTVVKTTLQAMREDLRSFIMATTSALTPAERGQLARRGISVDPSNERYLALARMELPPTEVVELVRPLLDERPVLVHAHRLHQDSTERAKPEHDLAGEYRALLAQAPADAKLKYLLARVSRSDAEKRRLLAEAARATPPEPLAFRAGALHALGAGRFDEALRYIDDAAKANVGDASLLSAKAEALCGLRRYDECLASPPFNAPLENIDLPQLLERIAVLVAGGRADAARADIATWLTHSGADPGDIPGIRDYLNTTVLYHEGKLDEFVAAAQGSGSAGLKHMALIIQGKLDEAAASQPRSGGDADRAGDQARPYTFLTLYVAAALRGDETRAEGFLREAIAGFTQQGDADERRLAAWLGGPAGPGGSGGSGGAGGAGGGTAEELIVLSIDRERKLLSMVALGLRRPELRDAAFDLARKLDFDGGFPHHLFAQALKRPS